jgi:hypothetical protein
LAIVRGERAPSCADGENSLLALWQAGLHQEPRFCSLEGLLRLSGPPGLQRSPCRLEQCDWRLV